MARFRVVGCSSFHRSKVKKHVQLVEEDTYDDPVVDEVDPNVQLVAKLQKSFKLFRDIFGDSDTVGITVYVYMFRALRSV